MRGPANSCVSVRPGEAADAGAIAAIDNQRTEENPSQPDLLAPEDVAGWTGDGAPLLVVAKTTARCSAG